MAVMDGTGSLEEQLAAVQVLAKNVSPCTD